MKTITLKKYLEGIESIYIEQPKYKVGHDGSDGYCDCIGMCKGAIRRANGDASGLSGTNYAARYTILNLRKITGTGDLKVGDVVLKTGDIDGMMPLPDKYRNGGSAYNGDLNNYTHIGTVTGVNPLEITHMTSPNAKKDTKLGNWAYVGWLPQVASDQEPEQEEPKVEKAVVYAASGTTVNMRKTPSTNAALIERVPIGKTVSIIKYGADWSQIEWLKKKGWMMSKYLIFVEDAEEYCSVTIPWLTKTQAEALVAQYPQGMITVG